MTLVVVGDFDPQGAAREARRGLGAWKPAGAKKPAKLVVKPAKLDKRLLLVDRKDAAQSDVRIGLVGLDRKDRRYFAFEVLATTLGGGFTSRLIQRLREQLGITYGAHAGDGLSRRAGAVRDLDRDRHAGDRAGPRRDRRRSSTTLATTDVPAEELEKSKQNLIRALPAKFETNAATAGTLRRARAATVCPTTGTRATPPASAR